MVEKRIEDTFKLLDSNNDGEISPEEIGIENLSPSSLIFLKPIFLEMDELNATLNFYEFKNAVKALMSDSDPSKKGAFLSEKWWKPNQEEEEKIP